MRHVIELGERDVIALKEALRNSLDMMRHGVELETFLPVSDSEPQADRADIESLYNDITDRFGD